MKGGLCKRFSLFVFIHIRLAYIPKWICNQIQLPTAM